MKLEKPLQRNILFSTHSEMNPLSARTRPRLVWVVCLAVNLFGAIALAADPDKGIAHHFKVSIESKMAMDVQGGKQKVDADTELRYNWTQNGGERVLSLESSHVKVNIDGKTLMDVFMSGEEFRAIEGGKTNVVPIQQAPDGLKKLLQDAFSKPVCKLEVDPNGKETKRILLVGDAAKQLVDNGLIANPILFHPPFMREAGKWKAGAEMTMGNGGFARGQLDYQKATGSAAAKVVKVSGTLTNESVKQPNSPLAIKNAKYVVLGEETYDTVQKEWVSGKLAIDATFDMAEGDKAIGGAAGTMVLNFTEVPSSPGR